MMAADLMVWVQRNRPGRGLLLLVILTLFGGCAHYETVPSEEAARRPQDKIVAYELKQIISAVVLTSGERQDFDSVGGVYDYVHKIISGSTSKGARVEYSLTRISSIEFCVPSDSLRPARIVSAKKAATNSSLWAVNTLAGLALPTPVRVKVKGRTGTIDTLHQSADAVISPGRRISASFSSVESVRIRVWPSVLSRKGLGLMGWVNASRLTGEGGQLALSQDWRSGLDMGAMVNYRLSGRLTVQTEFSWSVNRSSVTRSGMDGGARVSAIERVRLSLYEFTLLGKYSILSKAQSDYSLIVGPFLAIPHAARSQFDSTYTQAGFVLGDSGSKRLVNIRKPFVGARVGIELTRRTGRIRPTLGIRYSFGLTSPFKEDNNFRPAKDHPDDDSRAGLPLNLSVLSISAGFTVPF